MSYSSSATSVGRLIPLGEVVLSLGNLGVQSLVEICLGKLMFGAVDGFYCRRVRDLYLVWCDPDKCSILLMDWELVILSSAIAYCPKVPESCNGSPEGTRKVSQRVEVTIVYCQSKQIRDEACRTDLQPHNGVCWRQQGRECHGLQAQERDRELAVGVERQTERWRGWRRYKTEEREPKPAAV